GNRIEGSGDPERVAAAHARCAPGAGPSGPDAALRRDRTAGRRRAPAAPSRALPRGPPLPPPAEPVMSPRNPPEAERKHITVLFADVKASMHLLADRDPEEVREILDPVLERMMEAVRHYEGTVNQVMGDGIMALFGAPLAQEDHAVRACFAALRMQEVVR